MLEVEQEFAFTNGKQQHSPTEIHVRLTKILKLETENCQVVGVKGRSYELSCTSKTFSK